MKYVKVWYTDTDSCLVLTSDLVKLKDVKIVESSSIDKKFGDLEKEYQCDTHINIAAKCYMSSLNDEVIKWRLKGVRPDDTWVTDSGEEVQVKDSVKLLFNTLLRRDIVVKTWSFRNDVKHGIVKKMVNSKIIRKMN
jgi:hypothetical protein